MRFRLALTSEAKSTLTELAEFDPEKHKGQRKDKAWGLEDCASCLIMQERGISQALAYDEHFKQAGFVALLRDG
jgi:predicted nucleic acid-binding protein